MDYLLCSEQPKKKGLGFQVFSMVPKGPWEALKMELKLSFFCLLAKISSKRKFEIFRNLKTERFWTF